LQNKRDAKIRGFTVVSERSAKRSTIINQCWKNQDSNEW